MPAHDLPAPDGMGPALEAFKLHPAPDTAGAINPLPAPDAMDAIGWEIPNPIETFDPVLDGLKLLEAQRRTRRPLGRGPGAVFAHVVGGFAQHTVVTENGISSNVIHCWPDEIGRRIEPEA